MANDITPAMDLIAEALTDFYGERCPDVHPGCRCCEAWAQYGALAARPEPEGMRTTAEERRLLATDVEHDRRRGLFVAGWDPERYLAVFRDFDRLLAEVTCLRARLAEAEAEKGAAVAAERELLAAGASAANILYNMAQSPSVKDDVRKSMKAAQERWDAVRAAIRARGGDNG